MTLQGKADDGCNIPEALLSHSGIGKIVASRQESTIVESRMSQSGIEKIAVDRQESTIAESRKSSSVDKDLDKRKT